VRTCEPQTDFQASRDGSGFQYYVNIIYGLGQLPMGRGDMSFVSICRACWHLHWTIGFERGPTKVSFKNCVGSFTEEIVYFFDLLEWTIAIRETRPAESQRGPRGRPHSGLLHILSPSPLFPHSSPAAKRPPQKRGSGGLSPGIFFWNL